MSRRIAGRGAQSDPSLSKLHFTGVHVLEPELIARLPAEGESDINRTAYVRAIHDGARVHGFLAAGVLGRPGCATVAVAGAPGRPGEAHSLAAVPAGSGSPLQARRAAPGRISTARSSGASTCGRRMHEGSRERAPRNRRRDPLPAGTAARECASPGRSRCARNSDRGAPRSPQYPCCKKPCTRAPSWIGAHISGPVDVAFALRGQPRDQLRFEHVHPGKVQLRQRRIGLRSAPRDTADIHLAASTSTAP